AALPGVSWPLTVDVVPDDSVAAVFDADSSPVWVSRATTIATTAAPTADRIFTTFARTELPFIDTARSPVHGPTTVRRRSRHVRPRPVSPARPPPASPAGNRCATPCRCRTRAHDTTTS